MKDILKIQYFKSQATEYFAKIVSHHGTRLQHGPSVGSHVGWDGDVWRESELSVEADHLELGDDAPDVDEEQEERGGKAVGDLEETVFSR